MVGSMPQGHAYPDLLWQPRKAGKIWKSWQVSPVVGGVGNGVAEEDSHWDLNPGMAAMRGLTCGFGAPLTTGLGSRKTRCSRHAELSLSSLEECRTDNAGLGTETMRDLAGKERG